MSFRLQPLFLTFLESGSGRNFFGPLLPVWVRNVRVNFQAGF
jgi:hypothetical protein